MGINDFNQYSRASQRLFANLVFHLLRGAPSDVQRTVQSAEVSSSRRPAETSADWTVRCTFLPVDSGNNMTQQMNQEILDKRLTQTLPDPIASGDQPMKPEKKTEPNVKQAVPFFGVSNIEES